MNKSPTLILLSIIIGAGFIVPQLSSSIISPALPSIQHFFMMSSYQAKLIFSFFFIGYTIGQLLWGSLSDHIGRRRAWLTATALYVLAIILLLLFLHITGLFFATSLMGLAAAAHTSVGNAIIKDFFPTKKIARVIAAVGILLATGPALGALLGAVLNNYFSWRANYIFLGILALIVLVSSYFYVPETRCPEQKKPKNFWSASKSVLINRQFVASAGVLAFAFGVLISYLAMAPFFFTHYLGVTTYHAGIILMATFLSYIISTVIVLVTSGRVLSRQHITVGVVLLTFSVLSLILVAQQYSHNVLWIASSFSLMTAALGFLVPVSKVICMSIDNPYSGTMASWMKFLQTFITLICTTIISLLNTNLSILPATLFFTACTAMIIFGFRLSNKA